MRLSKSLNDNRLGIFLFCATTQKLHHFFHAETKTIRSFALWRKFHIFV
nr:MAG TPA: hypothetical protein [Crassvirales sp.]